jgi:hypothetical protein
MGQRGRGHVVLGQRRRWELGGVVGVIPNRERVRALLELCTTLLILGRVGTDAMNTR